MSYQYRVFVRPGQARGNSEYFQAIRDYDCTVTGTKEGVTELSFSSGSPVKRSELEASLGQNNPIVSLHVYRTNETKENADPRSATNEA